MNDRGRPQSQKQEETVQRSDGLLISLQYEPSRGSDPTSAQSAQERSDQDLSLSTYSATSSMMSGIHISQSTYRMHMRALRRT